MMTTLTSENEKRHFSRVPFISSVNILFDDKSIECGLLDISLKGLLIELPDTFTIKKNTRYSLTLILSEKVIISMQAKLVHEEANHYGLEWVDIDIGSLTILRRLLELNSIDPDEIH
ncbi:MAG: PilZ domain-containing protein [gamma proteobacterium symbiont of Bathyaustriella thionipta]|nr:PilZ domain-containing protein [gamma proteobacterium symbiont of Bathyaustriella thionipta]MCU7948776.1 PilZ domain-containing protein [gamma proteobacterium symbiont of Bathyaustriella thionipta]MCU7954987.1 PilZ domain-containing protein [gamma proteobacterium symbiont of Bathyaustriella thionipta]MCU7955315.1 PilZ domain-containing protein [gamma proteobacterium symbiont of Bathyaustriella thionipta]MCU7967068.1 PilZ domain-containing protein [gamma proteobacterium symbiont of Bathyaustr